MRAPVVACAVVLLYGVLVPIANADPNEPNDSLGEATPILCPFQGTGSEITPLGDVDFYAFQGTAGERVEIDVDASQLGSPLDPMVGILDGSGALLALSDDDPAPGEPFTFDSFLRQSLPSTGTYFVAVTSFPDFDLDGTGGFSSGFYALNVSCLPPPSPPGPGDLLGSTASARALIDIDPSTGAGSFRHPHGSLGRVTEIEFRDDGTLFASTGGGASTILTIDPVSGVETFVGTHVFGAVNSLEFVGSTLYGVYIPFPGSPSELVVVDQSDGSLTFVGPTGFGNVGGLAFDRTTGTLYGSTSGSNGGDLITIDPGSGAGTLVGPTGLGDIASLEFGLDGTLFGGVGGNSPMAGSLLEIDPATGAATVVGPTGFSRLSGLAVAPGLAAEIDIQPHSERNNVRVIAGKVWVALLGSEDFAVADVDVSTLAFGPDGASAERASERDVGRDGVRDLVSLYSTQQTGIAPGDQMACLTGRLLDGTPFIGCDTIRTIPAGQGAPISPYALPEARMTGGGEIRDRGKVTHGFSLHCDPTLEPNKLQVNWGPSRKNTQRFHLESLTRAGCTNDPMIGPEPPSADFDTHFGSGIGRLNGEPGATAEWTFTDAGEPGSSDFTEITIRDADGAIVLEASGVLKGGNHQAHGAYGALAFGEPPRPLALASFGMITALVLQHVRSRRRRT